LVDLDDERAREARGEILEVSGVASELGRQYGHVVGNVDRRLEQGPIKLVGRPQSFESAAQLDQVER
jgi:hypothetical protein